MKLERQSLASYLASCSRRIFGWGIWDCCLFGADVVQCVTGIDKAAAFRATYANEFEAQRIADGMGGHAAIAQRMGMKPVKPPYQDGDIGVLHGIGHVEALVVFWQGRFLGVVGIGKKGLCPIPSRRIKEVFRA